MTIRYLVFLATVLVLFAGCSGGSGKKSDVDASVAESTDVVTETAYAADIMEETQPDTVVETDTALDTSEPPDTSEPQDTADTTPPDVEDTQTEVTGDCPAVLVEGSNNGFPAGGVDRSFMLSLPSTIASGGPFAVVFNWHGFGDTAQNMRGLLSGFVNDERMPFILVTPEDNNVQPPMGFDWDVLNVVDGNIEILFYDQIMLCLNEQFSIDPDRIYSMGFSAGGIMNDLLGALRGDELAATVSYSGGYFSNPDNVALLGIGASFVSWPDAIPSSYSQVLMHGGQSDVYDLSLIQIHFDQFAANDQVMLNGSGHDVVVCDHNSGHTVPRGFMGNQVVEFFSAHTRNAPSPYDTGLPGGFPEYCQFHDGL